MKLHRHTISDEAGARRGRVAALLSFIPGVSHVGEGHSVGGVLLQVVEFLLLVAAGAAAGLVFACAITWVVMSTATAGLAAFAGHAAVALLVLLPLAFIAFSMKDAAE